MLAIKGIGGLLVVYLLWNLFLIYRLNKGDWRSIFKGWIRPIQPFLRFQFLQFVISAIRKYFFKI